jgi:hypothetical protein
VQSCCSHVEWRSCTEPTARSEEFCDDGAKTARGGDQCLSHTDYCHPDPAVRMFHILQVLHMLHAVVPCNLSHRRQVGHTGVLHMLLGWHQPQILQALAHLPERWPYALQEEQ